MRLPCPQSLRSAHDPSPTSHAVDDHHENRDAETPPSSSSSRSRYDSPNRRYQRTAKQNDLRREPVASETPTAPKRTAPPHERASISRFGQAASAGSRVADTSAVTSGWMLASPAVGEWA